MFLLVHEGERGPTLEAGDDMSTEVVKTLDPEPFTYSDGDLETVSSALWQQLTPSTSIFAIDANRVKCTNASFGAARYTGGSGWTSEQWAEITIVDLDPGHPGLILRASADEDGSRDYYDINYFPGSGVVQIRAIVNGSATQLGSNIDVVFADGDTIKAYAETVGSNTVISLFKNGGSPIATRADTPTSIAGGSSSRPGIGGKDSIFMDNFRGGILQADSQEVMMGQIVL